MKKEINSKENQITFWLNTKTYPLEAIYSANYVFLDRAYVFLDGDPQKEIVVSLKGKKKMKKEELEVLQGEFYNELLNYLLRLKIIRANKKVRDFIVGTALVSALSLPKLMEESKQSYLEDSLKIAIPWEEKFKKKKK